MLWTHFSAHQCTMKKRERRGRGGGLDNEASRPPYCDIAWGSTYLLEVHLVRCHCLKKCPAILLRCDLDLAWVGNVCLKPEVELEHYQIL